ncbi:MULTISPECIES: Crp/Fnr family transcriptional regulator [unclassified Bombella]|uniref:Crp/Fnr family transcriptional regulator n=1 Tax=unclassified Bombella TaxID=2644098 RepID=UPI001E62DC07|nr:MULTISPECIES: helix-turn-helix domain-containing protein [unclassified Bombella]MCT6855118.1 helix-turn-helix domain-containing protein [Bombella apis]
MERDLMEAVKERCSNCPGRIVSICNVINDSDLPALVAESSRVIIPPGRCFIEEGTPARYFYVLTSGRVKLFNLMVDGRRQIIGFADLGNFLGLASSETYEFTAEALGEAVLCRFSHSSIDRLIERFPRLRGRLQKEASSELVKMQSRLMLLGRKTARERLATFLMEQARPCCVYGKVWCNEDGPVTLSLPMSRTDIADYLGLTIETVSRTFSTFKKEGLISIKGASSVTLLAVGSLNNLANGML